LRRRRHRRRAGALPVARRCDRSPRGGRRADAAALRAPHGPLCGGEAAARGSGHRSAPRRRRSVTRRLVVLVLAGWLAALCGGARADDDPGSVLPAAAACAERLRSAEQRAERADDGEKAVRLAEVCADLAAELEARVWGEALVSTSAEDLSARSFGELVKLIEHYERTGSETSAFRVDELARIVESFGALDPVAELSPWERIVRFVRQRLGLDENGDASRLLNWLRRIAIPDEWQRGIVATLGILA